MCLCSYIVSCVFSWALFLPFICFVLFQYVRFALFYYYSLETCLFSNERKRECGTGWEGRWGGTERSSRREKPSSRYIIWEKNLFLIFNEVSNNTHSFSKYSYFLSVCWKPNSFPPDHSHCYQAKMLSLIFSSYQHCSTNKEFKTLAASSVFKCFNINDEPNKLGHILAVPASWCGIWCHVLLGRHQVAFNSSSYHVTPVQWSYFGGKVIKCSELSDFIVLRTYPKIYQGKIF